MGKEGAEGKQHTYGYQKRAGRKRLETKDEKLRGCADKKKYIYGKCYCDINCKYKFFGFIKDT